MKQKNADEYLTNLLVAGVSFGGTSHGVLETEGQ